MPKTQFVSVIPCLDTRNGRLVKGVHFVKIKELGDPAVAGKAYAEAGADELVLLDITATLEGRNTLLDAVKRTVAGLGACPLTVGGGIGSLEDMQRLFDVGVARVSMNSAAVRRPGLIDEAAARFGSARITVAIDTRNSAAVPSGFEVVVAGGTKGTGQDAVAWAREAQRRGAGSLLPTSMETDGVRTGYDLPMTRAIADAVAVPVIASGGAGTLEHLAAAVREGHADAVLVASIAHFGTFTIRQMKDFLAAQGIPVRT
ncbi:MAG: Imidazole glycerol phosphate synthase subunit HisF [Lentisphaerae bacterium ADurb.BinA184]|nr:MAG: Imidazole glycerol phosphate synthase subunit HisF [Lentisphaerae bacterium ADurb.BinA184]